MSKCLPLGMLTELLHGKETGTPDWVQQQMGHHFSGLSESDGLMILPECVVILNYLASLSIRKYTKEFNGYFKLEPFIQFFSILKNCLLNGSSSKIQGLFTQPLNNKRKFKWFQDSKYLRPVLFQTLHNGYKSFLESYLNLWKQPILII